MLFGRRRVMGVYCMEYVRGAWLIFVLRLRYRPSIYIFKANVLVGAVVLEGDAVAVG